MELKANISMYPSDTFNSSEYTSEEWPCCVDVLSIAPRHFLLFTFWTKQYPLNFDKVNYYSSCCFEEIEYIFGIEARASGYILNVCTCIICSAGSGGKTPLADGFISSADICIRRTYRGMVHIYSDLSSHCPPAGSRQSFYYQITFRNLQIAIV